MKYSLGYAKVGDEENILNLIYPNYFEESAYSVLDFDRDIALTTVENWIDNVCLIAKDNEKIVAVAAMYFTRTYYKQPEADVEMFYVHKDYRGLGISRDLVKGLVNAADENNCAVIYTSCACGINEKNDTLYQNLFSKFGFNKLGTEMVRINV